MTDSPQCREPFVLPPMHCTLAPGHVGEHKTAIIPEPLSAVAAEMLIEHDRMLREREAFAAYNARFRGRTRALLIIQLIGIVAVFVALVGIAYK